MKFQKIWEKVIKPILIVLAIVLIVVGLYKLVEWGIRKIESLDDSEASDETKLILEQNKIYLEKYQNKLIKKRKRFYQGFKIKYFSVRLFIITLYLGTNAYLFFARGVDIGNIVDINGALLIAFVSLYFLVNGKFTSPQLEVIRFRDWLKKRLDIKIRAIEIKLHSVNAKIGEIEDSLKQIG